MRILITGNPSFGLSKSLSEIFLEATFISRKTGHDLTTLKGQESCAELILNYEIFINCAALWKFNQTVLLDTIYKKCVENKHRPHIICIGSTTDRVKNGKIWLYNAEKKALRDYCNTLGINGVWNNGPKITLISFGSLSNVQHKHPGRQCLDIDRAAEYVKWIIDQPKDICVNEISVDPLQIC